MHGLHQPHDALLGDPVLVSINTGCRPDSHANLAVLDGQGLAVETVLLKIKKLRLLK